MSTLRRVSVALLFGGFCFALLLLLPATTSAQVYDPNGFASGSIDPWAHNSFAMQPMWSQVGPTFATTAAPTYLTASVNPIDLLRARFGPSTSPRPNDAQVSIQERRPTTDDMPACGAIIESSASSSSPPPSTTSWRIEPLYVQTLLGLCRGYTQPKHIKYCVPPGGTVDVSAIVYTSAGGATAAALQDPIAIVVTERIPHHSALRSPPSAISSSIGATAASTSLESADDTDATVDDGEAAESQSVGRSEDTAAAADAATPTFAAPGLVGVLLPTEPYYAMFGTAEPSSSAAAQEQRTFRGVIGVSADELGIREWTLTVRTSCGDVAHAKIIIEVTCSDQIFCNGQEVLMSGRCVRGPPACIDPLIAGDALAASCILQQCNEESGTCSSVWYNRTECQRSGCEGPRCRPRCAAEAECGSDGCGGVCGLCAAGYACRDSRCMNATYEYSCARPVPLAPALLSSSARSWFTGGFPISFSHTIDTAALVDVGDQIAFPCSNFRTQPDYVFRLDVPDRGENRTVGIDLRLRGRFNRNVDTLLQIRKEQCVTALDVKRSEGAGGAGGGEAALASLGGSAIAALATSICNDNSRPPGELSSRIVATLTPGTYYVIASTNPEYHITPHADGDGDGAAGGNKNNSLWSPLFVSIFPSTHAHNASDAVLELTGRLVDNYLPMCENKDCGDDEHGGQCGACDEGARCHAELFECKPDDCAPKCEGKVCGSDGCGGACGACGADLFCSGDGRSCLNSSSVCNGRAPVCAEPCAADQFCANDCACHRLTDRLPDLIVKMSTLVGEMSVVRFNFSSRACALRESCILTQGMRTLLRFSVSVLNQGLADVVLPDPATHPADFFFSPCHRHYHYNHFADYSLIQGDAVVLRGHKQAFCLEDTQQELPSPHVPCLPRFNCTHPGIQRGWSDYYGSDLDCQWIDISALVPGEYYLRIEVNVNRQIVESSFDNNVAVVKVRVPEFPA